MRATNPSAVVRRPAASVLGVALGVCLAMSACRGKKSEPTAAAVEGLHAIPASATVVVSIDVPKVAGSPLVSRAVDQLLLRDPDLASRWQRLQEECKLDFWSTVDHVLVALGQKTQSGAPVLMVATGKLSEPELASCVRALVGKGGGTLTSKTEQGRALYLAREGDRSMWFGFGNPTTVVLGSDEAIVTEALGPGAKAAQSPELSELLTAVDRKAPVWAVGRVDPALVAPLLRAAGGGLSAGPQAYLVSVDPTAGMTASLTAVMASDADAKSLESLTRRQLDLLSVAAQLRGLGRLVGKITAAAKGKQLQLAVALDPTEINQLLKAVDSTAPAPQDAPPIPGPAAPSQPSP